MTPPVDTGAKTGLVLPETLGPYRIEGLIGAGGMGVVYRALAPDGTSVALKTLLPHMVAPRQHGRFLREASIRIDHPNVITVLDSGSEGGTPYIALELLEGESFEGRLAAGILGVAQLLSCLTQACAGLAAVHAAGIVHRDLKPANLFCCDDGTLKILDFGIARMAEGPKLTMEGTVLGSVSYLSPEQARGRQDIDPSTDVWAMGVVIYEALTGTPPFDRDTALTTVLQIIQGQYVRLAERVPHVPRELCAIVDRCLQRSPTARYPDGAALHAAMAALDGRDTERMTSPIADTREARLSLPAGEERIVVVMLARDVSDPAAVEEAIFELGGEAIPFLGQGVIGVFGGVAWEGDEAGRAVEAALRCRSAAAAVAVGSGRARSRGSEISGAAVVAAERGCRAAFTGVAIDADAAGMIASRFELIAHPGRLHEVVRRGSRSSVPPVAGERLPTFGRDLELMRIHGAVAAWRELRRPRVIEVVGPLGIGKSRLRAEFEHSVRVGAHVLSGRGQPVRKELSLDLWASVLLRQLRAMVPEDGSDADRAEALLTMTRDTVQDDASVDIQAAFLRELLRIPGQVPDGLAEARSDPQLMRDRLRLAILDHLEGLARRGPLVVVLEDLQWVDQPSIDLLEDFAERSSDWPVLFFLTSRQGVVDTDMGPLSDYPVDRFELGGLAPLHARQLAIAAAGRRLPEPLVEELVPRCEGNPLFIEQVAAALREGELDDLELATVPLPTSVEAALQSRLDRLPRDARELVKRASVLRRAFLAEDVEGLEARNVSSSLELLLNREILIRVEGSYAFRSRLVAEVTYNLLTPEARVELHALAASYLEHARGVDAEEAAGHHEQAGAPGPAAACYARSALGAAQRGDSATVLRCTDKAFELGFAGEGLYELHLARGNALRFLGRRAEQERHLDAALAHAKDECERARALTEKASLSSWLGRQEEAARVADQAVEAARASGDGDALVRALCLRAETLVMGGRSDAAEAPLREAGRAARDRRPRLRADVFERRALWADSRGDLGESLRSWERALVELRTSGALRRAAGAQQNLADCYSGLGAFAEAEAALREALESCRRVGHRVHEAYAIANLGRTLARQGKTDEALDTLAEASARARAMGDDRLSLFVEVYRARALAEAGRWEEVAQAASETAKAAKAQGRTDLEVMARAAEARAQLAQGRVEDALDTSERALALRDQLGGLTEGESQVFLVRVQALERAGRLDDAAAVREVARVRLREIASRIRDPAWRARFLEAVPENRELLG